MDTIDDLLQARSEIDEELRRHKARITVLFTDIVGSTNYFDRFGDTAGLLLLHRHDNYVSTAVAEFDGTVIKTIGDSVMAEFPEPLVAVRAAIEIQRLNQRQLAACGREHHERDRDPERDAGREERPGRLAVEPTSHVSGGRRRGSSG